MTKKDFIFIANVLASFDESEYESARDKFAKALVSTNPRFDCDKFVRYCDKLYNATQGRDF